MNTHSLLRVGTLVAVVAAGLTVSAPAHATPGAAPAGRVARVQVTKAPPNATKARAAFAAARPLAAAGDDINGCDANPQSQVDQGWAMDRFHACYVDAGWDVWKLLCTVTDPLSCTPVGEVSFEEVRFVSTANNSRSIDVHEYYINKVYWGDLSDMRLTFDVNCTPIQGFGTTCTNSDSIFFDDWAHFAYTKETDFFSTTGLPTSGDNPNFNFASYAYLQTSMTALVISSGLTSTASSNKTSFGCDSEPKLVNTYVGEGCVFEWAPLTFHLSLSNPQYGESANLIRLAQMDPRIPGRPGSGMPLHRITTQSAINANRRNATPLCRQSDPNYPQDGLSCDEYPFASTKEGAARGAAVAFPIDATDNASAGGTLGAFYRDNRVLGDVNYTGDAFYVQIDP